MDEIRQNVEQEKNQIGWNEIFYPTPAVKRMLIVVIGVAIGQQVVGIESVMYYSTDMFQKAGIETKTQILGMNMGMGFFKTATIIVVAWLLDRPGSTGRRP